MEGIQSCPVWMLPTTKLCSDWRQAYKKMYKIQIMNVILLCLGRIRLFASLLPVPWKCTIDMSSIWWLANPTPTFWIAWQCSFIKQVPHTSLSKNFLVVGWCFVAQFAFRFQIMLCVVSTHKLRSELKVQKKSVKISNVCITWGCLSLNQTHISLTIAHVNAQSPTLANRSWINMWIQNIGADLEMQNLFCQVFSSLHWWCR